jgi:hypothetical protein
VDVSVYSLKCSIYFAVSTISRHAKLAHDGEAFQLYSSDTYTEFHVLMIDFLEKFQDSLMQLSKNFSDESTTLDESLLEKVILYGRVLQKMSKSAALQAHLQVIHPILHSHRYGQSAKSTPVADKAQDGECDEKDEELEAVQPFVTAVNDTDRGAMIVPLWKSYVNWLRLLVVHFDAVDILVRHFDRSRSRVSLQLLVMPPVDTALLTIQKLIKSHHFPTEGPVDSDSDSSNDDILKFLDDGTKAKKMATDVQKTWNKVLKSGSRQSSTNFRNSLQRLSDFNTDLWSAQDLRKNDSSETEINTMVEKLIDATKFFENATSDFSGTLHCEAYLASLLSHQSADVQETAEFADTLVKMKVGDTVAT